MYGMQCRWITKRIKLPVSYLGYPKYMYLLCSNVFYCQLYLVEAFRRKQCVNTTLIAVYEHYGGRDCYSIIVVCLLAQGPGEGAGDYGDGRRGNREQGA